MSSLGTTLLAAAVAIGLSAPAFAQSKMDAGSGAVSTNDAGTGPTSGATPKMGSTAAGNSNTATQNDENSAGVTPGPKSRFPCTDLKALNEENITPTVLVTLQKGPSIAVCTFGAPFWELIGTAKNDPLHTPERCDVT